MSAQEQSLVNRLSEIYDVVNEKYEALGKLVGEIKPYVVRVIELVLAVVLVIGTVYFLYEFYTFLQELAINPVVEPTLYALVLFLPL